MIPGQVNNHSKDAFRIGHDAWPGISITEADFSRFLEDAQPPPRHLEDFYLAMAAGLRVDPAWQAIETHFGPRVRRLLVHKPKADYFVEDLWQEILRRLWTDVPLDSKHPLVDDLPDGRRPAQIIRYGGRLKLVYFLTHKGVKIAQSRHEVLKQRQRKLERKNETIESNSVLVGKGSTDAAAVPASESLGDRPTPMDEAIYAEDHQAFIASMSEAISSLSDQQQALMRLVFVEGLQKKQAGQLLGLEPYQVTRELAKVYQNLRSASESLLEGQDEINPGQRAAWEKFLQTIHLSAPKPAP